MEIRIVIPARLKSTRLPGKPMAKIGDRTLIEHVYDRAMQTGFPVTVLTDSPEMKNALLHCDVRLTEPQLQTGTDRIASVSFKEDIIINCQGDLPFVQPQQIVLPAMLLNEFDVGTLIADPPSETSANNRNIARAICTGKFQTYKCNWFTRTHISYGYHHIGVYAYKREMFKEWRDKGLYIRSSFEQYEDLEQLRFLENGYTIGAFKIKDIPVEVNTPDDLENARNYYEKRKK